MPTSTAHFIVQTKLAQLRGQRDELARSYDAIEAQAAQGHVFDRVRALHEGLAGLSRAGACAEDGRARLPTCSGVGLGSA